MIRIDGITGTINGCSPSDCHLKPKFRPAAIDIAFRTDSRRTRRWRRLRVVISAIGTPWARSRWPAGNRHRRQNVACKFAMSCRRRPRHSRHVGL